MNLYIIELAGKKYIASAETHNEAVKAIMLSLGIEKATANVTIVSFESAWWIEAGDVTFQNTEAK